MSKFGATSCLTFKTSADSANMLSGVALNASEGTRTLELVTSKNWSRVKLEILYTYSAATTLTIAPTFSLDGTYASETSGVTADGIRTLSQLTDTYTTNGASANLIVSYDVSGMQSVKFVFGGAGAGAGDLVTVQAVAVSGY